MYKTAISYATLITNVDIPDSVNSALAEPPAVAVVAVVAAGRAPPHTVAAEPAAEPDVAAAVPRSRLSLQTDQKFTRTTKHTWAIKACSCSDVMPRCCICR